MSCVGCGEDKRTVKAHIVPAAFFKDLRDGQQTLLMIGEPAANANKKRYPIGVYDKNILCRDCEDIFQNLDSYGAEILIHRKHTALRVKGKIIGYRIEDVDTSKLKLFFISILWRASVSSHPFYRRINLGPSEQKVKKIIWDSLETSEDEFSFVLGRFAEDSSLSKVIMDPHPDRWWNVRYYRFYFGGYVLYIKSDAQRTPHMWRKFIAKGSEFIVISRGRIENSKEFAILKKNARN